jgi:hypothetical protein
MAGPKIEFFTEHEELLEFPPIAARKVLPGWFKQMSPSIDLPPAQSKFPFGISKALRLSNVNATIRRCPGVISYLSEGYLIPLWSDFLVQVRGETVYCAGSNELAQASPHSKAMQYSTMPLPDDYLQDSVKFTNPWKVRTPPGWSVMLSQPFYHFEQRFTAVPGVVDSDVYHHIHVNTFFRKGDRDHQLKMGMPFVHVMPFQRSVLEPEVRVMTEKDHKLMKRLNFMSRRFFGKNAAIRGLADGED